MKIISVNLPNVQEFDVSLYNISLDLENRQLILDLNKNLFQDDIYGISSFELNHNVFYNFSNIAKLKTVFCITENNEEITLFGVFCVSSSPLTFHFDNYVRGFLYDSSKRLEDIYSIEFNLSFTEELSILKEYQKYELLDMDLEIIIDKNNKLFRIKAINKKNLVVDIFREKIYNVLYYISLIFYNPFAVKSEKYELLKDKSVCEFCYDSFNSGYRKNRFIDKVYVKSLFENIFVEDSIDKFLKSMDENFVYLIKIYLSLIDKENHNYANINDFLIIQLMISAEQHISGELFENKVSLEKFLGRMYVKEFVVDEMSTNKINYLNNMAETRNSIGHLTVLFKGRPGSKIRKIGNKLNIEFKEYFKLVLLFPFFFYSVMNINIDNKVIKIIVDDFNENFHK